ncbi:metallophosphatase family protein [Schlegelella sp. S2-27]|uniref:Phosphoesterase n=1 Tax=Caldimonas mangrovi TaxID=2944811 RepID=A0ABT0YXA8_9BURK|nr:metallophosphoesterase family protein [Caldimonas mangrovi]MCM5682816.1 metallophosphatase family protein [Caldimonas mangrovi]
MRIGLISDTHGLLRDEALAALRGCDHIVHSGDIGTGGILERLAELAPVTAIRGNNDEGLSAFEHLPDTCCVDLAGTRLYVLHDLAQLAIDPAVQGVQLVVSGHSHKPRIDRRNGVLYVNPGSAGPRRFALPVAVAIVTADARGLRAETIELSVAAPPRRR